MLRDSKWRGKDRAAFFWEAQIAPATAESQSSACSVRTKKSLVGCLGEDRCEDMVHGVAWESKIEMCKKAMWDRDVPRGRGGGIQTRDV